LFDSCDDFLQEVCESLWSKLKSLSRVCVRIICSHSQELRRSAISLVVGFSVCLSSFGFWTTFLDAYKYRNGWALRSLISSWSESEQDRLSLSSKLNTSACRVVECVVQGLEQSPRTSDPYRLIESCLRSFTEWSTTDTVTPKAFNLYPASNQVLVSTGGLIHWEEAH
jgi:hypothetical protein